VGFIKIEISGDIKYECYVLHHSASAGRPTPASTKAFTHFKKRHLWRPI